ncbi:type II toxin-antitoxin system RelE/ParE family toxin [Porticoccus sp. GXU_MW_L64]
MPSEIVWLSGAVRDVSRLRDFIREKNPAAAQRAASRIKEAAIILSENPEAGRPVEDLLPFRDLLIPFGNGNYVLRYREEKERVVIVRVWHSREERI